MTRLSATTPFGRAIWPARPTPLSERRGESRSSDPGRRRRIGRRRALEEQRVEIDRVNIERRIAAAFDRVGHDLTGEGKQQARPLDHDRGLNLGGWDILDTEDAGVIEFELEQRVLALSGAALEQQRHLVVRRT